MKPLQPPDTFHLQAARGWCELHAYLEANEELEKISSPFSVHPDVLRVCWEIYANLERWEGALEIAGAIIKLDPGQANCWLYKASSFFLNLSSSFLMSGIGCLEATSLSLGLLWHKVALIFKSYRLHPTYD